MPQYLVTGDIIANLFPFVKTFLKLFCGK